MIRLGRAPAEGRMFAALDFNDFLIIALIALACAAASALKPREQARLARLERKVDMLLQRAGITYDPKSQVSPEVLEALRQGNKIQAIKLYREATGVGLKEAKDFVEEIQS